MKRGKFLLIMFVSIFGLAILPGTQAMATSFTFSWEGFPIEGEREDFLPSGVAIFDYEGDILTLTLTNTTTDLMLSIGEVLTGLTWDITGSGFNLVPHLAMIDPGSRLVGVDATGDTNLSTEWAFRDDLSAGSSPSGPIGSFGISAVGDLNFVETYGPKDRFDTEGNLFPPPSGSPNGMEAGIVGPLVDFTSDGFTSQGPVVQGWDGADTGPGEMIFTFDIEELVLGLSNITNGLDLINITNVQPMYGSDGAFPVPEPATMLLFGFGLIGLAVVGRKKFQ